MTQRQKGPIGVRIRQHRMARGLTGAELARRSGMDASTISFYETGARKPGILNVQRIAAALDIGVDALLNSDASPSPAEEPIHAKVTSGRQRPPVSGAESAFQHAVQAAAAEVVVDLVAALIDALATWHEAHAGGQAAPVSDRKASGA